MNPMMLQALMQMMGGGMGGMGGGGGAGGMAAGFGGAGLSLLGGILGSNREKAEKKKMETKLRNAIRDTQSIMGRYYGQADAAARKATGEELGGYDTARREASRLGRSGKQRALDRETQLSGSLSQGLTDRGLGSTTVGGNVQRGISADTLREMGNIDEGLAGMFGQLALGRAGTQAQGTRTLSDLGGQQAQMNTNLAQMGRLRGGTLGNFFTPQSGPGALEMSLPGISAGFGQAMGSMGGQGGIDPRMLQWLFGGQSGGYNPNAGQNMNLNTFAGS